MKFLSSLDENTKKLLFTFLKIFGVLVVILIIFMIIAGGGSKGNAYSKVENNAESAAKSYYNSHEDQLPKGNGETTSVTLSELVSGGYMKESDTSCEGYVSVTKADDSYYYNPSIKCGDYKTNTIANAIKNNIVTSDDGVYEMDEGYYYRGKNVNNYIKIDGTVYRIIGMDSNNNVKVIDSSLDKNSHYWDNRFNVEKQQGGLGINSYDRSILQEDLETLYQESSSRLKSYVLNSDWCVGKRSQSNDKKEQIECEETVKGHFGTITAYEFARISVEEACETILDGSCSNYNYLASSFSSAYWTLTGTSDNTYTVYYIINGGLATGKVSNLRKVLKSFNISGDNLIMNGNGSKSEPFIIK